MLLPDIALLSRPNADDAKASTSRTRRLFLIALLKNEQRASHIQPVCCSIPFSSVFDSLHRPVLMAHLALFSGLKSKLFSHSSPSYANCFQHECTDKEQAARTSNNNYGLSSISIGFLSSVLAARRLCPPWFDDLCSNRDFKAG